LKKQGSGSNKGVVGGNMSKKWKKNALLKRKRKQCKMNDTDELYTASSPLGVALPFPFPPSPLTTLVRAANMPLRWVPGD
jgi:hypothetical protein